ncbi:MAG TPA: cytochrome c oxidase subunit II [Polyangia bacterium]|nr:cytochrome c oxidase subunit II [Polyangia bacterium]
MTTEIGPSRQAAVNELLRRILFLPPQSSTMAPEIDHLHFFVIGTTMVGAAAVGLLAVYWVIKYRAPEGAPLWSPTPAPATPTWLELMLGGGLLTLFCVWWFIGYMQYVHLRVSPENALDVYVTAKQWMWKFAYADGQSSVSSLYVPTGRPIRVLLTSRDVIHSFFVPDFRIKQDAVPGRYTTAWFEVTEPGVHQVLCAEYCGTGHSVMRGQVVALDPADYARWLAGGPSADVVGGLGEHPRAPLPEVSGLTVAGPHDVEPASEEEFPRAELVNLVRVGTEASAQQGCLRCHTLDGTPHIGPTWAGLYRNKVPLTTGQTVVADEAYLTESMMDPLAKVHAGYAPVMPSYHGLLAPAETAAIVELIKHLRDVPGRATPPVEAPRREAAPPAGAIGRPSPPLPEPRLGRVSTSTPMPLPVEQGLPPPGLQTNPLPAGRIDVQAPTGTRDSVPSARDTGAGARAAGAAAGEGAP